MKNLEKLTNIIEAILFVSGTQVAISDIAEKLEVTDKEINEAIKKLKEKYSGDSGICLLTFNKKIQFSSASQYADEVSAVLNPIKEKELSRSMLEVAAIIAYKQPVTRIDLEEIRGNSEYAVQKLLELGMIEPVGRKDAVGRPVMFGTTDTFLKRFQISSLDELPRYEELINQVNLIHGKDDESGYLYKKDVYVEENTENNQITAENQTNFESTNDNEENLEDVSSENTENNFETEIAVSQVNSVETNNRSFDTAKNDDFILPEFDEEEIPDFLKGEKVDKI